MACILFPDFDTLPNGLDDAAFTPVLARVWAETTPVELRVSYNKLGPGAASRLSKLIARNKLATLTIYNLKQASENDWRNMAHSLASSTSIRKFEASAGTESPSINAAPFIDALLGNTNIAEFSLTYTTIDEASAAAIAQLLAQTKSLRVFNIRGLFSGKSVRTIADGLARNTTLRSCEIKETNHETTRDVAAAFWRAIEHNTTLHEFALTPSCKDRADIEADALKLLDTNTTLRTLGFGVVWVGEIYGGPNMSKTAYAIHKLLCKRKSAQQQ